MSRLVYQALRWLVFLATVHHQIMMADQSLSENNFSTILNLINDYRKTTVTLGLGIGSALAYTAYRTRSPFVRYATAFSLVPLLGVPLWAAYLKRGAGIEPNVKDLTKVDCGTPGERKTDTALDLFGRLVEKSDLFNSTIAKFPTSNNRIKKIAGNNVAKKKTIGNQALNVWPIAHVKVRDLIEQFVQYKARYGSNVEKEFYTKHIMNQSGQVNIPKFITRLLTKRPLGSVNEIQK